MQQITIGILAGGKSTRMGENKALLTYRGRTFLENIRDELSGLGEVLISAAAEGIYEKYGCPVLYDEQSGYGPLEGIYRLLKEAETEYVFVCAVDMPLVKKELVLYMQSYISSDYDCYCIKDAEHIHPLCAIYSKRVLPYMEKLISEDRHRLMDLLQMVSTKYISLEWTSFDKSVVQNINTQEDYHRLQRPVVFCVSAVKNSGKTSLIEKLIEAFQKDGYRVGVIKHDGHDFVVDHEGTDSYRFTQKGAKCSIIYSDRQYAIMGQAKKTTEELVSYLKKETDIDVIIIEGRKDADYPKIEVVRKEISSTCVCNKETLICVASDIVTENQVKCPVYVLKDIAGVYDCIKKYFRLGNED